MPGKSSGEAKRLVVRPRGDKNAKLLNYIAGGICAVSLAELGAVFKDCGLTFRRFEDCTVPFMRWQAGRIGCIEVESARGWIFGEAFELIVFASTSSALIERLAELDGRA